MEQINENNLLYDEENDCYYYYSEEDDCYYLCEEESEENIVDDKDEESIKDEKSKQDALKNLFYFLIFKKWWMIVASAFIAGILSSVYSFYFAIPIYSSTAQIIIIKSIPGVTVDLNEYKADTLLTKDATQILKSDLVLNAVIKGLAIDDKYTAEKIRKNLTVSAHIDTRIIKISYENPSAEMSARITNSIGENFITVFNAYLAPKSNIDVGYSKIMQSAVINESPVKPNILFNIVIAMLIGAVISTTLLIIIELLDKRIKSPERIVLITNKNILGTIPLILDDES